MDEPIVDPDRPLIDPHHHLWPAGRRGTGPDRYVAADLVADTASGHRVTATIAVECRAAYLAEGPGAMAPTGESLFLAEQARALAKMPDAANLAGVIAHVDLRLGHAATAVVEAHREASGGLLVGVRQMAAYHPQAPMNLSPVAGDLYADPAFRDGLRAVAAGGLVFDAWHYHPQAEAFEDLVAAFPDVRFVLDHFGTPLGAGGFEGRRAEVFADWRQGMRRLAAFDNVAVKASGFTMSMVGSPWRGQLRRPTSDEVCAFAQPYVDELMEAFGPARCMFASNFPVEKSTASYAVLWNALKKTAAGLSEAEKDALCRGTAVETYGLGGEP